MLNSVEEAFEEHVVLLFICEFGFTSGLKCAHQLTELLFVDFTVSICVPLQVFYEGSEESVFGLLVVLVVDWPF